jgi:zinc transport system permease protein
VLNTLRRLQLFSADALLGILSHTGLATGLIVVAIMLPGNVQLNSVLFGDILALNWSDVWISLGVSILILIILATQWHALIARTISEPIAAIEKIGSNSSELIFMVLCSGLVAIAMKITGVLLISALLILPAAIARILSRSPEQMAVLAAIAGAASVISGLVFSLYFDLPSGPAIIVTAAAWFVLALIISGLKNKFSRL